MHIFSYRPAQAQYDIITLLSNGGFQHNSGSTGCCRGDYLAFPNDHQKYYYYPKKLITNTLVKPLFDQLCKMSTKSVNQNQTVRYYQLYGRTC